MHFPWVVCPPAARTAPPVTPSCAVAARHLERPRRHDEAVGVGVDEVPGAHAQAGEAHLETRGAHEQAVALDGVRAQRLDAQGHAPQQLGVANAAEDDDAGPAVRRGERAKVVAHECAAPAAAAVHHKHAPAPVARQRAPHQQVALEALHGHRAAAESVGAAVVAEEPRRRGDDARRPAVRVAQVRRLRRRGEARVPQRRRRRRLRPRIVSHHRRRCRRRR
mmetsp:Transcript_10279/g.30721  ORF Transcript_10279/g.30721 Transcript_10279/m.30721 type:complete len:221 (+) Transcript_10279:942-1604(+)